MSPIQNPKPKIQNALGTDPPLLFRDPKRRSFTMMPDAVLMSPALSPGAKLVYEQLLHYARRSSACFPGQATLARHLPATERAIRKWLRQLEAQGMVTVERRGRNVTNRYWIESLTEETAHRLAGAPSGSDGARRPEPGSAPDRNVVPPKQTQKGSRFRSP